MKASVFVRKKIQLHRSSQKINTINLSVPSINRVAAQQNKASGKKDKVAKVRTVEELRDIDYPKVKRTRYYKRGDSNQEKLKLTSVRYRKLLATV